MCVFVDGLLKKTGTALIEIQMFIYFKVIIRWFTVPGTVRDPGYKPVYEVDTSLMEIPA